MIVNTEWLVSQSGDGQNLKADGQNFTVDGDKSPWKEVREV